MSKPEGVMGGGTNYGQDVVKGPPRDILAELSTNGDSDLREAIEFCARVHQVRFELIDGAPIRLGQSVVLAPGDPPVLVSGAAMIGLVVGDVGRALGGCLELDYTLTGFVDEVDLPSRAGLATLAGTQQR